MAAAQTPLQTHGHAVPQRRPLGFTSCIASVLAALAATAALPAAAADAADDPVSHVRFVEDFAANCVARSGVRIQVQNTHPSRRVRVWLDRFHMGVGTGDRSRTDLAPGAEPEPLGCSRSTTGAQEWRLVKAQFVD